MPVRLFDRVDDQITTALGSLGFAFGPGTIAAIVRRTSDSGAFEVIIKAGSSGLSAAYRLQIESTNRVAIVCGTTASSAASITLVAADGWCLIAGTKATGTVAPRLHKCVLSTGTWTHADASTTVGNSGTPGTSARIGATQAGSGFFGGDIGIIGVSNTVFNDAAIEALDAGEAAWDSAGFVAKWMLDQASTATALQDDIGAADETSITGTSVTAEDIPWVVSGVTGTSAQTLPSLTQAAAGTTVVPDFSGTSAQTLPVLSQAAAGTVAAPVTSGTAAQTLPALSSTPSAPTPARVVSDGIWTWFNGPNVIDRNGSRYIGWIRSNGDVCVSKIVLSSGARTVFTLAAAFEVDDHDNPALAFTPAGRLVALYCEHGSGSVRMRIASNVEDIETWGAETTVPDVGTPAATYANAEVLPSESDRLYVMFRGSTFFPVIIYSDDWDTGTPTWSTPRELFEGSGSGRPYLKYVSNGAGKLHFVASSDHPNVTAGTVHLYHWYYDAADANFHTSDGTVIRSLASLATTGKLMTSEVTKVYDATSHSGGGNGNAWPWDIQLDGSGNPVVVFSDYEAIDNNRYVYARWTGAAWVRHVMLSNQGSLYGPGDTAEDQYAGGLCINPSNTGLVYLANDSSGQWEIEQWNTADGGSSWTTTPITVESSAKNARPVCPRGSGGPDVLWWRGQTGASNGGYASFTSYRTDIWAAPAVASPAYRGLMVSMAPTAYLPLDEPSGTLAEDIINSNDGTHVNSPTLNEAGMIPVGKAVTYNGTDERTDLPDLSLGEGTFSYVVFFKTTQTGNDRYWIAEGSTTDTDPITMLGMDSGEVRGFMRGNSPVSIAEVKSGLTYNDGALHHAAVTYDGTALRLMVDGVRRDSPESFSAVRSLDTTTIGALRRATVGQWAAVTLDEAALFNRALSESEVNALFEARDTPAGANGNAAQVLPALTQAAAGETTEAATVTGTSAQTLPSLTQQATAAHVPPVYTGTSAQTLPSLTQTATGQHGTPVYTGTMVQTLPMLIQTATGQNVSPRTGTAAQTLPAITQTATGTHVAPTYTAEAEQVLPALVQAAFGLIPVNGTITQTLPSLTQTATGAHTEPPSVTGAITQTLPVLTQYMSDDKPVGSVTLGARDTATLTLGSRTNRRLTLSRHPTPTLEVT